MRSDIQQGCQRCKMDNNDDDDDDDDDDDGGGGSEPGDVSNLSLWTPSLLLSCCTGIENGDLRLTHRSRVQHEGKLLWNIHWG